MKKMLLSCLCLLALVARAQDPQFSQYYSAPLILNPAMTGATDCYRVGLNARTQWTALPGGAFNTASVFIDLNYPDYRSGFGLLALRDVIGTPRMSSSEMSAFYSYLAPVSKMVNFRFGLQGSYIFRDLDYSRLVFEDQYRGIVVTNPSSADPVTDHNRVSYTDFSAGMMLFGEKKYWLGMSAHHLNRPEQAFYLMESRLPIKYSLHGGINFYYKKSILQKEEDWLTVVPTFMYKAQAKFDQLDVGIYFIKSWMMFGGWYRGIPLKKDENIRNNDAIVLQAGAKFENASFTYSYDFTTSRLNIRNTYGSHEISIIYLFCLDWPHRRKPPRHVRKLPCPDFKRSLRYKGNF